jgi:hypothetical protein
LLVVAFCLTRCLIEFANWDDNTVEVSKKGVKATKAAPSPAFVKPTRTESTMNVPEKKPRRKKAKEKKIAEVPEEQKVPRNPFLDREIAEQGSEGLTSEQVKKLIDEFGYNEVVSAEESFAWKIFKMYVQPINILVLIAAILSVVLPPGSTLIFFFFFLFLSSCN